MARKSTPFDQDIADHILERIINGQSLSMVCDEEGMPTPGAVLRWRVDNPIFATEYDIARELQAERLFEEMLDIIDDGRNDWMEKEGRNGTFIALNPEAVARSKARVDTRFRMMESMAPKYSKKIQVDHSSKDGTMSPKNMTDEQKAAKITAIIARAEAKRKLAKAPPVDDGSDLV